MDACTTNNCKSLLAVLLAFSSGVFFMALIMLRTPAGIPIPAVLTKARSYLHITALKPPSESVSEDRKSTWGLHLHNSTSKSPSGSVGDEGTFPRKPTWSPNQTTVQAFEHSELFKAFVRNLTGNKSTVTEYLASQRSYLLGFRSPMIREHPEQYSWPETQGSIQQGDNRTVKRVVWYNRPSYWSLSSSMFSKCPVATCELSWKYRDHATADAVMFEGLPGNPPPRDHPDQLYILHIMESPANTGSSYRHTPWNSAVNWTWSYRVDSDMFTPVGYLKRVQSVPSHTQLLQTMQRKTKLVAWFVSRCNVPSRRLQFVHQMQKVLPVDIYGHCGPMKCARNNAACTTLLNDYFFYLSFENSYCEDYITEKYYKTFNEGVNVLSVVRGGGNYSRYFPEGTFIDAESFAGSQDLARYLLALSKDPARYVDMMWKRAHFVYLEHGNVDAHCQLCFKLHHPHRFNSTHTDIFGWYHQDRCTHPKHL